MYYPRPTRKTVTIVEATYAKIKEQIVAKQKYGSIS